MTQPPLLKIASRVTRKHAAVFAREWLQACLSDESIFDAFEESGVMEWPEGGLRDPRHARYHDIEDEILERTFAAVRDAVAEAFTKAAREVLARERKRQK